MRLLHLSDIHFRSPDCLQPLTDTHRPYRTLLTRDVLNFCRDGRSVDAILVGGDIAFKGHPDEYLAARAWLLDLANKSGCATDRIYVVPGNHDVDRDVCERSAAIDNAQRAIAGVEAPYRERTLRRQLADKDAGPSLFYSLNAYNDFAKFFGCNVFPSDLFWTDELNIEGGLRLRLFGLTSTLLSGLANRDDAPGQLYLSPLQTAMSQDADDVNLVLCHHPPNWFSDYPEVDDHVNSRAMLQFFGHEHRQRCTRDKRYMRFTAGAVNPDKMEPNWRPGYNLIDIEVSGEGLHRMLNICAKVRNYQHMPEMFVAVMDGEDQQVWTHSLSVPQYPAVGAQAVVKSAPIPHTKVAVAAHDVVATIRATEASSSEATMSTPNTRNLVIRFWNHLSISERRDVALKLGLITQDDFATPEPERYAKALREAAKRNLLLEVAREIETIENRQ